MTASRSDDGAINARRVAISGETWRWGERLVVDAVHLDQIREHGGLAGVRDEDSLEAALARARHKWHYDQTDVTMLAAAYGFALCRNHPYRDGNKRAAFIVMVIFLDLNGLVFDASDEEIVTVMVALAEGHLSERKLAEWLRAHTGKRKGRGTGGSA